MPRRRQASTSSPGAGDGIGVEEDFDRNLPKMNIRPFDPDTEPWEYYLPYFELELRVARIRTEDDKRDLLLTKVGSQTFKFLVDHFRPAGVSDQSYGVLIRVINDYYVRENSVTTNRVAFILRKRAEDEDVGRFINALRALAGKCEYGQSLSERVRDQLIVGINNEKWQYEFLRAFPGNNHTLAQVEALARQLEQGQKEQQRLVELTETRGVANVRQGSKKEALRGEQKFILVRGRDCFKCGKKLHKSDEKCPAEGGNCRLCGRRNHFARVCFKNNRVVLKREERNANMVRDKEGSASSSSISSSGSELGVRQLVNKKGSRVMLSVEVNKRPLKMLYDPGAHHSVISKKTWEYIGKPTLNPYPNLIAYTNLEVRTLGITQVEVTAFGNTQRLPLIVVNNPDVPLFGLEWVLKFNLPLPPGAEVCAVGQQLLPSTPIQDNIPADIKCLIERFSDLFIPSTGTIKGHKIEIRLKEGATPRIFKPRPVPFALKPAVEQELNRLVSLGIIEQIDPAITPIEWASPLVVAPKANGKIRLCADFKVTINKYIVMDRHPLPTFEEVSAHLAGGEQFSVIDLRDAYLQMEVAEESKKYLILSTHKGFFRYCRMPFGISSAPAKFQRTMEVILAGIEGVSCYLDDIIVTAKSRAEHVKTVEQVLSKLCQAGMRIQLEKCKWLQDSVVYLGHRFDKHGIYPTLNHITAIQNMTEPTNQKELRSFLGCINYYQKFVPNLQGNCILLYELLKKGNRWKWTKEHGEKFNELKGVLTAETTLAHYTPALPLILYTDASEKGVGGVLCHRYPDKSERPIAYTSRVISAPEQKYSVIDREALGIVHAIRKFERYLYGRRFILKTDHRPLTYLFAIKLSCQRLRCVGSVGGH